MSTWFAWVLCAGLAACAHTFGTPAQPAALEAALRSQPVVLLGEVHDNVGQHALRATALQSLLEGGARPALLMEQFDREHQADIDRVLARADASPDAVIAAAAPADAMGAGWDWALYRPFIELAIRYRLPLLAANVSRADARRATQQGLAALGFQAAIPGDIEAAQTQSILDGHCGAIDVAQARHMVPGQEARDQFMARLIEANASRGVVLLAGNGHVRRDVGVPRWLSATTRERSVAIGLLETGDDNAEAFDRAFFTPAQSRPDPCEGFRPSGASA